MTGTQMELLGPVGLVVEGPSEVGALPELLIGTTMRHATPVTFLGQDVDLPVAKFVQAKVVPTVKALLAAKRLSRVVVVFDRESRSESAVEVATEGRRALLDEIPDGPPLYCAVPDRMFENWLIADPERITRHNLMRHDISSRVGNAADGRDALGILRWAFSKKYIKTRHARQLAALVDLSDENVLGRSPSLRRFLDHCRK